jgi:4-amino-4-deoxy-L-arabinose transferase-like glycosyltransferase
MNKTTKKSAVSGWLILAVILIAGLASFLRLYSLDSLPPSLYWEEVALGYDAWSLATTGKDHHGQSWPVVAAESFGDYKPTGYLYALLPFVKVLGLNAWAVRLPSVLAGIGLVGLVGWLGVIASPSTWSTRQRQLLGLIAAAVTAISPWAVQFSRGGWEVNLATCLLTLGMLLGLKVTHALDVEKGRTSIQSKTWGWAIGCAVLLVASMYTYHALRVIAPVLGVAIAISWLSSLLNQSNLKTVAKKYSVIFLGLGMLALVLAGPLLLAARTPEATKRWQETSLVATLFVADETNQRVADGGYWPNALFYHRYILIGKELAASYFSHWRFDFLFVDGDVNLRHGTGFVGLMYLIEAPILIIGLWFLVRKLRGQAKWVILTWLVLGVVPAALTTGTPHALRILPIMPPIMLVLAWGWMQVLIWFRQMIQRGKLLKKHVVLFMTLSGIFIIAIYAGFVMSWWRFYTKIYPVVAANDWQYGYQELVFKINELKPQYQSQPIFITRSQGRPAMYYWFFSQTPAQAVQAADATAHQDQAEFLEFGQFKFVNSVDETTRPSLVASSQADFERASTQYTTNLLHQINDPKGKPIWLINEIK